MKYFIAVAFLATTASAVSLSFPPTLHLDHPAGSGILKEPRIVGGEEVPPHRVPYHVGIFAGDSFCSGSLINARYVLTSAHCGSLSKRPIVVLGAHRIKEKEPEQVSLIGDKVILHPHWDAQTFRNDIALIMLPRDVKFTAAIQPIDLAPPNSGSYEKKDARVTGWGVTADGDKNMSDVLRYTINHIMPNKICDKKLPSVKILDSHICFCGENGRSPCLGDAGAPVISEYQNRLVQVGIVSFMMEEACEKGYPAGMTRVSYFYNWILANM